MNDDLKQFSAELATTLKAKIESAEFSSFITTTKASGEDRTFEVVMSTSDEDRQGDELDQSGWDLKYFNLNPVVLWAHNYSGFPIGIVTDIKIEGDKAIATGKFALEGTNPEADLACKLYQQGILRTVSPGYIQNDDGTRELLELSFCSVPAGRYALSMRQVAAIGYSTPELIAKGFFYKQPAKKAKDDPEIGEACEMEDGGPGVLAKDPKKPDRLICVPTEGKSKSKKNNENMNELEKKLKAEHERHGEAVKKSIDEFDKAMPEEKAEGESAIDKAIEEFETKMDDEQEEHREKCDKAIDDAADKIDPEEKKSIDEFKKAMEGEHLKHVKCFDKAIEEFKGEATEPEKCEKAIADFRTKAEDELERHEKAHEDMVKAEFGEGEDDGKGEKKVKGAVADEMAEDKERQAKYNNLDRAYSVFYAFTSAYMDDSVAVDDFEKLLDEAVTLMKNVEAKAKTAAFVKALTTKSGRAISAKTKAKIEAVMKSIEEFHSEHTTEHEEFTTKAIAALKEVMTSPQGDEGKENAEDKSSRSPHARSSSAGAATNKETTMSELDAYLFAQRLMRQVKSASEDGLRQIKENLKTKFPSRR